MPAALVRRTWLALRDRAALRPAPAPAAAPGAELRLARRPACSVAEYRALYAAVGERWLWRDRLAWPDARLAEWLARPDVEVHVLEEGGAAIGYFELHHAADGATEIVYFGLVERAHGRGLGGWLLTRAAEEAFARGARVVWLHTCSLDGPTALANYLARGFVPFRTEEYVTVVA